MDLNAVADELYGVPPAEFVRARDEFAARARASGDDVLAAQIKALRKPTATAAALNALSRNESEALGEFVALAERIRSASEDGTSGADLRELMKSRRELTDRLLAGLRSLPAEAGVSATGAVVTEVQGTLLAAVSDGAVAALLASGRLSVPPSAESEPLTVVPAKSASSAAPSKRAVQAARRRVTKASEELARRESQLRRLTDERDSIADEIERHRREVENLEAAHHKAEHGVAAGGHAVDHARSELASAERDAAALE